MKSSQRLAPKRSIVLKTRGVSLLLSFASANNSSFVRTPCSTMISAKSVSRNRSLLRVGRVASPRKARTRSL
eukprot:11189600-Lingulodinium_polyedra.AAC.1